MKKQLDENEISKNHTVSMDVIPFTFDIPMARTVAQTRDVGTTANKAQKISFYGRPCLLRRWSQTTTNVYI